MLRTRRVFHCPIGWLKEDAPLNIAVRVVTLPIFQLPMAWLKEDAPWNIECMLVT
jgi:hypothetical protein